MRKSALTHTLPAEIRPWNSNGLPPSPFIFSALIHHTAAPALPHRTLRSGKEYSAFDLVLGHALQPAADFDVAQRIQQRLAEEDAGLSEEDEADDLKLNLDLDLDLNVNLNLDNVEPEPSQLPPAQPPALPAAPTNASLSAKQRNKVKSHAHCDRKRDEAHLASSNPAVKMINQKHVQEGKANHLPAGVDITDLPHSQPAWVGLRQAQDHPFEFTDAPPDPTPDSSDGLGGIYYTQEEVDALSGTKGFMYLRWLGLLTIPIIDRQRRIITMLGGTPRDVVEWKHITDGVARMLREHLPRMRLPPKRLHHRRAQDSFAAIARGPSHGGGQTEPGELQNNIANTQLTDELLASKYFLHIAHFASILFAAWAQLMFAYYTAQMALLALWKPLRRNFPGGIFAACTFNFGPLAVCTSHIDFANLAWGWCAITALSDFDLDQGGHLILWDLRLVIHFPPGSTILIPSALICHSNVPIQDHEYQASFVQYTAGGLFRWVRNGFWTAEEWVKTALPEQKTVRAAEDAQWWEEGVRMYSCIDDL
ncbi:hypothetical protein B0H14DRAFT_2566128 [Mycena olivaceomarginata]|nr:hypothetical protein B0H14DRAFT_2566128 [Mycena olivaceomarginata]